LNAISKIPTATTTQNAAGEMEWNCRQYEGTTENERGPSLIEASEENIQLPRLVLTRWYVPISTAQGHTPCQ